MTESSDLPRCPWPGKDPLYIAYHDTEWGVPQTDDQALLAKIILEGFQAGLSWITILRKRPRFVAAFDGFDPEAMARYGPEKIAALMADEGIVRNRAKIEAAVTNARAFLRLKEKGGSFAAFVWAHVDGRPRVNHYERLSDIPAQTPESRRLARALKQAGFRFVGPTTVYAFMQSVGMVNDHLTSCHRHAACARLAETFTLPKD